MATDTKRHIFFYFQKMILTNLLIVTSIASLSSACTNFIVTPGASKDGSMMLAYNADDHDTFGILYHYPASNNTQQPTRKIWDWETGIFLGEIPQPENTYNVIGNCNEVGVCVGETTWAGTPLLSATPQTKAKIDYGSLMWITLQRSNSARAALDTMTSLMDAYGYHSTGETFSIVDDKHAWVMDVIGRGADKLGAVWVARKVPDGSILVHANHAKITTFPLDDPDNCLYSHDVIERARELGLYKGKDEHFNFQKAYDGGKGADDIRYEEARVFDVYSRLSPDPHTFYDKYIDYAMGRNLDNVMPIWIEPEKKVSLEDVIERMSSHYEDSSLEYGFDVGGGIYSAPYRPKPNSWTYEGNTYVNERSIAVEKTALSFIAVIRGWMPTPLKAIVWVGCDDSSTSPRYPVYACSTSGSSNYIGKGPQDGVTSPILKFDWDQAFWIQNLVANFVYSRWNIAYPVLQDKLEEVHKTFVEEVKEMDERALEAYREDGPQKAVELLTAYSVAAGDQLHQTWIEFFGYLFARFRDFIVMEKDETNLECGCKPTFPGIDEAWKARIVEETGSQYLVSDPKQISAPRVLRGTERNEDMAVDQGLSWFSSGSLVDIFNVLFKRN